MRRCTGARQWTTAHGRRFILLENKRNFLEGSGHIVERVDPVFFSDPMTAAMKALGMT
jgi:ATP-dependent Lon protease